MILIKFTDLTFLKRWLNLMLKLKPQKTLKKRFNFFKRLFRKKIIKFQVLSIQTNNCKKNIWLNISN